MSRRLILVRHAKTEPTASSDRERELTERGRRQAELLGPELAGAVSGSVLGLVSVAVRAGQTWDGIAAGLDDARVQPLESLYTAGPDDVLDEVRSASTTHDTVIVVGHNPAIADLVWMLAAGAKGEPYDALQTGGYSPSTTTVFEVAGQWAELDAAAVTLTGYVGPQA